MVTNDSHSDNSNHQHSSIMFPLTSLQAVILLITSTLAQQTNPTPQNATAFSLLYGYPLLGFQKLATPLVATIGVNSIVHSRELATAAETAVVKPNVDTLYSVGIFDLSHNDVHLQLSQVPSDQYALFSFYDPYGDNFANLGTGNFNSSRSVDLVQRSRNGSRGYGLDASSGTSAHPGALIYSPSAYGIMLIRWLVNSTNLDLVHRLQNEFVIANSTINSSAELNEPSLIELHATSGNNSSQPAQNVYSLLSKLANYTGPELLDQSSVVEQNLLSAGISSNESATPGGVDLNAANSRALATAANDWLANQVQLNNGWSMLAPNKTGDFQQNYGIRAAVASGGYLMLQAPNAIYPSWSNSSNTGSGGLAGGDMSLAANESLLYTFSGKPPLQPNGFWSLTAYSNDYLIPNNLSVYALGDRSNLTYPDGSKVYGGTSASSHDGEFQILIQAANIPPPMNWTRNWLPSPAGGGSVSALLRWYLADESLLNGSYKYPIVTKQAAVTNSSNGAGVNRTSPSGPPSPSSSAIVSNGVVGQDLKMATVFGSILLIVALCL